jgi:hypothetical protein
MLKDYALILKKYFYHYILRKNYFRVGKCNMCGRCCEKIYVKHGKKVLQEEEHFYKLRKMHKFYEDLDLMGKDENGLIFACKNLDKETRKCKIHTSRAKICRDYPQEEIFKMGGDMARTCGYKFVPIFSFENVMDKVKKSKKE